MNDFWRRVRRLLGYVDLTIDSPHEATDFASRLKAAFQGVGVVRIEGPRVTIQWTAPSTSSLGLVRHSATQVFLGRLDGGGHHSTLTGYAGTQAWVFVFIAVLAFLSTAGLQSLLDGAISFLGGHQVLPSKLLAGAAWAGLCLAPLGFYRFALRPFAHRDRAALIQMLAAAASASEPKP